VRFISTRSLAKECKALSTVSNTRQIRSYHVPIGHHLQGKRLPARLSVSPRPISSINPGTKHLLPPNSQSLISCNSTMAAEPPSSLFDLPANFEYAKGPETGRTYYIDHTTETSSWVHPRLKDELPPNVEYRIDKASGKIYFVDHANKTTSLSHPCHKDFHRYADSEPELHYPTSSVWMHKADGTTQTTKVRPPHGCIQLSWQSSRPLGFWTRREMSMGGVGWAGMEGMGSRGRC
jgi:hypothetical protein